MPMRTPLVRYRILAAALVIGLSGCQGSQAPPVEVIEPAPSVEPPAPSPSSRHRSPTPTSRPGRH